MKYLFTAMAILCLLSGCRTAREEPIVRAQWDNSGSHVRTHTYEVTGTTFTKDYGSFVNSKPMELTSIVVTHLTFGQNTVEVSYYRDGYINIIPPAVTYNGFTYVKLMEAPLMLQTGRNNGDVLTVTCTRGETWQLTLNFK